MDCDRPLRPDAGASLWVRRLAHELNSLLDGSMRHLRLAERSLAATGDHGPAETPGLLAHLRTAHEGMARMADLVREALDAKSLHSGIFRGQQSLGAQAHAIVANLSPLADECGVQVSLSISADAACLPADRLGPVIQNGLRNAIQACVGHEAGPRCVDVVVSINPDDELVLTITDTGRGLSAGSGEQGGVTVQGRGLGLGLCRQIIQDMGGRLSLTNGPHGCGAIFQVVVPKRSLTTHE